MRVAVLGAGYAGVVAARTLEDRLPGDVELVVVDDSGDHLVQHEVHRVIRRPSLADEIRIPLSELLDRATVRTGCVTDLDPVEGRATLADGSDLSYDYGILALGAETAFYGLPGVKEHATPLKRVSHARTIRDRFLEVCELAGPTDAGLESTGGSVASNDGDARSVTDPPATDIPRVVVVGAGLSGIQVAGELATLADERGAGVEVLLLEQADDVAPAFPANFQAAVREELLERGVTIRTGATVREATGEWIHTDEGELAYDQFVWTGGIESDDAIDGERPVVEHTLRLTDRTVVAGDAARVVDRQGKAVPDSSRTAIRQASVAAENVARLVEYERDGGLFEPRLESYTDSELGWLVSVGNGAVAQVGPTVWTGRAAKAMKTTVGAGYLSSIGAVRNAVDLVNEEVGIAGAVE